MTRAVCRIGVLVAMAAAGCHGNNPDVPVAYAPPLGDAERGRHLIEAYRCGTCHTIPGVRAATGLAASPLVSFSHRAFIGGEVPNTAANLVAWLRNPQAIEPRTAMPALGVSDVQARDIAAYLYTVR